MPVNRSARGDPHLPQLVAEFAANDYELAPATHDEERPPSLARELRVPRNLLGSQARDLVSERLLELDPSADAAEAEEGVGDARLGEGLHRSPEELTQVAAKQPPQVAVLAHDQRPCSLRGRRGTSPGRSTAS